MDEDFEEPVEDEENLEEEEGVGEEVEEVNYEELEEVIAKPSDSRPTEVSTAYIASLASWYYKLLELRDVLRKELEVINGMERELVRHELREVEKEIGYVKWRIYEGLKAYRSICSKRCGECPLEFVCERFSQDQVPRKRGSSEPWLIPILLKKYSIE